ncbi:MAG: UvrD-helicase domain-containing protein, partial [Marinicaulis sp.]|nr:UvrD-helicase domain-containing protein [Marinicaulis sp.]
MTPLEETTLQQTLAADPSRSAFVLANAGSGKTRVLTNRVARLLAAGVDPQKILCITFTKAASVEMTVRLFDLLGEWAFFDDGELQEAFRKLEGSDFRSRSGSELAKIRVLFARALETPGGLKIQTIHSFCENVLKRFPLEAGVPPGFAVMEDSEASTIIEACIDQLAIVGNKDAIEALRRLSNLMFEPEFRGLLRNTMGRALRDGRVFSETEQPRDKYLFHHLGVNPTMSENAIIDELLNSISQSEIERAHYALEKTGGNPKNLTKFTAAYLNSGEQTDRWNALDSLFLVNNGAKPRDKITTKATDKIDPWAAEYLSALQERFWASARRLRALKIAKDTIALDNLTSELQKIYAAEKSSRAYLDFDDLIIATRNLFAQADNAWVMYKLDNSIDHILIDEAQDTSPHQWAIVEQLIDDYLAGGGARDINRSFFAVGDLKQSIYAFQGADAKLFETKETQLGQRLSNVGEYLSATLAMSFRSTRPVLEFVDALFAPAEAAAGLGDETIPKHLSNRNDEAGLVEIWPLAPRPEKKETNPWDAPIDMPGDEHPTKVLSRYVAQEIQNWIGHEVLPSQDRLIEPGDILILVQTRGALFNEVIRQLSINEIAVAGADRLKLLEDPAIEDMLSFAKFATYAGDDLSLAEILKSPLYGFTEDELFEIAHKRGDHVSLWSALRKKRTTKPRWNEAYDEISAATKIGLRKGPFGFYSHLLEGGAVSGRKRFFERLTNSSKDSLDELLRQALAFERRYPRSLKLFVDWFERNAGEIKREMENANNAVRVMTVHGAKGLEAPIVILL